MTDAQVYGGAVVAGAVAGMRSMSAPAIVSRLAESRLQGSADKLAVLHRPTAMKTTAALAIAELIADKLPFMPNRTEPASLAARAVSGALSGAAICSARKRSVLAGALLGTAAAIGMSYGAYQVRKRLHRKLNSPDLVLALAEDAIAASAGVWILRRLGATT